MGTKNKSVNIWHPVLLVGIISLFMAGCTPATPTAPPTLEPSFIQFTDVAQEVGIDFQQGAFRWEMSGDPVAMMGGGLCWIDYDQDGWLDLFVVNSYAVAEAGKWEAAGGLPRSGLFHNEGGTFEDVANQAGADLILRGNGCVAADLNLDGWPDLYITTARSNVLLWNNQDGTFSEGAEAAGVAAYGWQTAVSVGDLNHDGLPDMFVAGYVDINNRNPNATQGFPNTHIGRRDLLYINEGNDASGQAIFSEQGAFLELDSENEYGLGATLTDFDGDGDLDLFVSNDTNPNRLYENVAWPGGKAADPHGIGFRLTEIGQAAAVGDENSGMGVASGDYDGDGRFDLIVTNLGQQLHSVYQNQSAPQNLSFDSAAASIGLPEIGVGWTGWGISWADIDLDTDLDLIIVNGSVPVLDPATDVQKIQFFSNLSAQGHAGLFEDSTNAAGFSELAPILARGSAVADFDNDGDLDVAINTIGGQLALLRNEGANGNWLTVNLEGFYPGAVVTAVLPNDLKLLCEVHAGSSYLASEDPRCHFGLGAATEVKELQIRWPDGATTRLENISANQLLSVAK